MRVARLWTRVMVGYHLLIVLAISSSLAFRFFGQELPGMPFALMGTFTGLDIVLMWSFDRVQASEEFKRAAEKSGYPNAMKLHDGLYLRRVFYILSLLGIAVTITLYSKKEFVGMFVLVYAMHTFAVGFIILNWFNLLRFSIKQCDDPVAKAAAAESARETSAAGSKVRIA